MLKSKPQEIVRDPNEKPVIDTGIMNRVPFFSVCIPTHNRASFLPKAIESVLSQDFTDFELVICDNASTDNTEEVIRRYYEDDRVRYVRFDNFVNMYANHNRCIKLTQAEWLIFLHSDDFFHPNILKNCHKALSEIQDESIAIIAPIGGRKLSTPKQFSSTKKDIQNIDLSLEDGLVELIVSQGGISPSGCCFKRTKKNDFSFDEWGKTPDVFTADRTLLLITLANNNKIRLIQDTPLTNYENPNSSGSLAYGNANWHIGLSRSMKLIIEHSVWQKKESEVISLVSELNSDSQLDFLIRVGQAKKWRVFLSIINSTSLKPLFSFRVLHIIIPSIFGMRFYKTSLFFLKKIK